MNWSVRLVNDLNRAQVGGELGSRLDDGGLHARSASEIHLAYLDCLGHNLRFEALLAFDSFP